jgi:hydroxyacylglutathione hydrolase
MMYEALHSKLGSLPDSMRIFCGHEYTESNLVFAAAEEPDNAAVASRLASVREVRANAAGDWHDATASEMTIPTTIADERATNPFLRARDAEDLGQIRTRKDNF